MLLRMNFRAHPTNKSDIDAGATREALWTIVTTWVNACILGHNMSNDHIPIDARACYGGDWQGEIRSSVPILDSHVFFGDF